MACPSLNTALVQVYYLFVYIVFELVKFSVEFLIYIHEGYWPVAFFCYNIFVWLGIRAILASQNELESSLSSAIFWMSFVELVLFLP